MCTSVALLLPPDADRAAIAALSEQYKVAHGFDGGAVKWKGDELLYLAPRGMCFCGTAVALLGPREVDNTHELLERFRRDLEKKGWGPAKIRRNLEERQKHMRRHEDEYEKSLQAPDHDLEHMWVPFLRGIVGRGYASRVGIVAFEHERAPRVGASVAARDLEPQLLTTLEAGEVLVVTP